MKGYYKQPAETAKVLKDGLLSTGDLGHLDEFGLLRITGRKKDVLVLSDGTKIYLPEYEGQLAAELGHTELAVILKDSRPVLICQAEPDPDTDPAERKAALLKRLSPLMKTLPRGQQITDILFTDTPLPRTTTGKIKRYELGRLI